MSEGVLIPDAASLQGGYTLGQMLDEVRQFLRARKGGFMRSATFGGQGDTVDLLIARVRNGLRDDDAQDANRFIKNADIVGFINEGIIELGDRTHTIRSKLIATTPDATGFITIPSDFTSLEALYVGNRPTLYVDDDEEWNDWAFSTADPPRTLCRVVGQTLQLYPAPGSGTSYELHYVAKPYLFVDEDDTTQTNLPVQLHSRVVNYARAQANWRMRNFIEGDRYMGLFQQGLGQGEFDQPEDADKAKPREVQDFEIIQWINAGQLQVCYREECILRDISDIVATDGTIPLPEDYLRVRWLRLSSPGRDGRYEVELTDETTFEWWAFDSQGTIPDHSIGRIMPPSIETYPVPAALTTYYLRYVAAAATLVQMGDRSEVPATLQRKVIDYAKSQALLSAPMDQLDLARADRMAASFESGLRTGTPVRRTMPGPISLQPEPGWFDTDHEARHQ